MKLPRLFHLLSSIFYLLAFTAPAANNDKDVLMHVWNATTHKWDNPILPGTANKVIGFDGSGVLSLVTGSGGGTWGSITGSLSSQTDLSAALSGKQATITTGSITNAQLAGSIANAKLANSSITLGGNAVSLGGSLNLTTPGDFSVLQADGNGGITTATPGTSFASYDTIPFAISGMLKGDGIGYKAVQATAGTDYVAPSTLVNGHALNTNVTVTASDIGLANVTNDTQTKASIVPNTAPTSGQILIGTGSAYAKQTLSGSGATFSLSSAGVLTVSGIANASLSNSAMTIAGTSTALGGTITQDTITGLSSTGLVKRTGANALAIATAGTDYAGLTANSFTGLQTATLGTNSATPANAHLLTNTTAATVGVQSASPSTIWTGQGWKTTATAASQSVACRAYVLPVQGTTNPTGRWVMEQSVNAAAYSEIFSVKSDGSLTSGSSATVFFDGNNFRAIGANAGIYNPTANLLFGNSIDNFFMTLRSEGLSQKSASQFVWTDGTSYNGTVDTGLARDSAGKVRVTDGSSGTGALKITSLEVGKTITTTGTTGAQTINKTSGSVNFAAAATSLVVTNSLCTTSSVIICTIGTNDATAADVKAVAGSGTFTIYMTAPTAETRVNFLITN
jgi:hypothetical protein